MKNPCYPIVLEDVHVTAVTEQPDVFAFTTWGNTLLVECKASMSDFRADAKKSFRRRPEMGMGRERYYCFPEGLAIHEEDIPAGWGVMIVGDGKRGKPSVRIAKKPERMEQTPTALMYERTLLIAATKRAMQGWGRRIFGADAPADMVDGDPDPSSSKVLRELRAKNAELDRKLRAFERLAAKAVP